MSPKGNRHEIIKNAVAKKLTRLSPEDISLGYEPQFNLSVDTYTHPDIFVHFYAILQPDVRGPDVLLVVEIADSSLNYDLTTKAPLYASFGVREYWVINAATLETKVFRDPAPAGYPEPRSVMRDETLASLLCPALVVRLADIRLA